MIPCSVGLHALSFVHRSTTDLARPNCSPPRFVPIGSIPAIRSGLSEPTTSAVPQTGFHPFSADVSGSDRLSRGRRIDGIATKRAGDTIQRAKSEVTSYDTGVEPAIA